MPEISWQSDIQGKSLFTLHDQDPEHKLIKFCSFKFISPFPLLLYLTMTNLVKPSTRRLKMNEDFQSMGTDLTWWSESLRYKFALPRDSAWARRSAPRRRARRPCWACQRGRNRGRSSWGRAGSRSAGSPRSTSGPGGTTSTSEAGWQRPKRVDSKQDWNQSEASR